MSEKKTDNIIEEKQTAVSEEITSEEIVEESGVNELSNEAAKMLSADELSKTLEASFDEIDELTEEEFDIEDASEETEKAVIMQKAKIYVEMQERHDYQPYVPSKSAKLQAEDIEGKLSDTVFIFPQTKEIGTELSAAEIKKQQLREESKNSRAQVVTAEILAANAKGIELFVPEKRQEEQQIGTRTLKNLSRSGSRKRKNKAAAANTNARDASLQPQAEKSPTQEIIQSATDETQPAAAAKPSLVENQSAAAAKPQSDETQPAKTEKQPAKADENQPKTSDNPAVKTAEEPAEKAGHKGLRVLGTILAVLLSIILALLIFLAGAIYIFEKGPSAEIKELFVVTVMQSSAAKPLARLFLSREEVDAIMAANTAKEHGETTDTELIDTNTELDKNEIIVEDVVGPTYKGKVMIVNDPSRVFVVTLPDYSAEAGITVADFVNAYGATAGINAGGFLDEGGRGSGSTPLGIVISQGVLRSSGSDYCGVIGFDSENKLVLGYMTPQEALQKGIRDAVEWGPYLIINGQPADIANSGGLNPRTAIGQRADGAVIFVVIDGRQPSSLGASYFDLIGIMEEYGVVNAANLDGGYSSSLVYNGEVISETAKLMGERAVPTAILVEAR